MTTQKTLQFSEGGLIPTSPLHLFDVKIPDINSSKWFIKETNLITARKLVWAYHYLGEVKFIGNRVFGLFAEENDEGAMCVGVAVYGPLSVPNSAQSAFGLPRGNYPDLLELHRLVLMPEWNGKNAGSYLIGRSLRMLKKLGIKAVISYADTDHHLGSIYQACNFTYHGLTPQKSDFFFADGTKLNRGKSKGMNGKWVLRSRKHRYLYLFDKSLDVIWPQEAYPKANK